MKSYLVLEGAFDAKLMTTLVEAFLPQQEVVVVEAGGRSNAVSLARSLLIARHQPVLLAVDAETVNPRAIRETKLDLESLLGMAADPSLWRVVLFEPEIEVTLLSNVQFAEALFKAKLTSEQLVLIRYDPKKVLADLSREHLSAENGDSVLQRLAGLDLKPLAETPAIREILEFLGAAAQRTAA
jgi:hypothetical protein